MNLMPKIKTSELTGPALDWAVSILTNPEWEDEDRWWNTLGYVDTGDPDDEPYMPSENWAQGGPILNRYKISRTVDHSGLWIAYTSYNLCDEKRHMQCDGSELVAGLRCFVASKLGDEVELPEDICT